MADNSRCTSDLVSRLFVKEDQSQFNDWEEEEGQLCSFSDLSTLKFTRTPRLTDKTANKPTESSQQACSLPSTSIR